MRTSMCAGALALAAASGMAMAGDELVTNGSLEGGSYENGDWGYIDGTPFWFQDEDVWANHAIGKSAWVTSTGNAYSYYFPNSAAYDGVNAADVNEGIIWQDLGEGALVAGAEYEFSVALADNGLNDGDVIWNLVMYDDLVSLLLTNSFDEAMNPDAPHFFNSDDPEAPVVTFGAWTEVSFTFVATGDEQWIAVFGEDRIVADAVSLVPTGKGGCLADCNGDGVLNVLDFVCFQTEWVNQTPAGDCDGNGTYNVLDFVCYQGVFEQGCN